MVHKLRRHIGELMRCFLDALGFLDQYPSYVETEDVSVVATVVEHVFFPKYLIVRTSDTQAETALERTASCLRDNSATR